LFRSTTIGDAAVVGERAARVEAVMFDKSVL
jgi:hypothetical protein